MKKFLAVLLFLSMSSVSYAWLIAPVPNTVPKVVPQIKLFQLENKIRVKHPFLKHEHKRQIRMTFESCV
jgi:hypothetical protein